MTLNESKYTGPDGLQFHLREWLPGGEAKAVVVGVHGYAEHGGRYNQLAEFITGLGCSFHMIDNRAHGKSGGKRAHVDSFDDFVRDLRALFDRIRPSLGSRKLFLLGHSNGSLISIRYALKYQSELDGLILSGAALRAAVKVPAIKLMLMPHIARLVPRMMFASGLDPNGLCHDPEVVKAYINDPMVYRVISANFAYEMFTAMEDSLARAAEITIPVVMLHGDADPACDPSAARDFFSRLGSSQKALFMYPGMFHEVFNEVEKEKVFGDLESWLKPRI